jgi:hypothetical protein
MSPHQAIAVAVRLFAIWLAIYAARTAPSFYRESVRTDDPNAGIAVLVVAALVIVFVLFLWFFPRTVARGLLDTSSLVSASEPASPDTWFAVGCALIGLWLIVPALASVIYRLSLLFMAQRNLEVDTSDMSFAWVYYIVQFALGVWLLLGARGARRLFWWARNAR